MTSWHGWVAWLLVGGMSLWSQESRPESSPATNFTLGNGLRVRLLPAPLPGDVAVLLGIHGAGALSEPVGLPNLAYMAQASVAFSKRSPAEFRMVTRWFRESLPEPEVSADAMTFVFKPAPAELESALGILARLLFSPQADPVFIERLGAIRRTEAARQDEPPAESGADSPGVPMWSAFNQIAFHSASSVRVREPTAEIDAPAVAAFTRRSFRADRTMVTVVGDFDLTATKRWIEELFGKPAPGGALGPESRRSLKSGTLRGSWDLRRHHSFIVWPGPARSDKAYAALDLLADAMTYRFQSSPEIGQLVDGDWGAGAAADLPGFFVVHATLREAGQAPRFVEEITKLLALLAKDPLGSLDARKDGIRRSSGSGVRYADEASLETRVLMELHRLQFTLSRGEVPESYCARTDAVTPGDVHAAIKQYLSPEKATIVTIAGKE